MSSGRNDSVRGSTLEKIHAYWQACNYLAVTTAKVIQQPALSRCIWVTVPFFVLYIMVLVLIHLWALLLR
jgi:hypothetical protein